MLHLDQDYDLFLSMTWSLTPVENHGISGHIYEIIDYYLLLKSHFKVGILLCEDINWDQLETIVKNKYNITKKELQDIKSNTVFASRPKIVRGKNILFTDGGIKRAIHKHGGILFFKNIINFRCSYADTHYDLPYKNMHVLQDERIYDDDDKLIATNYKKKLKFDSYTTPNPCTTNTGLLYMTKNCRLLTDADIIDVINTYNFEDYIILTSTPSEHRERFAKHKNLHFPEMPVKNIFERFSTYIYTPTYSVTNPKHGCFDCSPRFIAECAFYNKDIIYHNITDEYLSRDTGLKYRRYDIENNMDSIILTPQDDIINILNDIFFNKAYK